MRAALAHQGAQSRFAEFGFDGPVQRRLSRLRQKHSLLRVLDSQAFEDFRRQALVHGASIAALSRAGPAVRWPARPSAGAALNPADAAAPPDGLPPVPPGSRCGSAICALPAPVMKFQPATAAGHDDRLRPGGIELAHLISKARWRRPAARLIREGTRPAAAAPVHLAAGFGFAIVDAQCGEHRAVFDPAAMAPQLAGIVIGARTALGHLAQFEPSGGDRATEEFRRNRQHLERQRPPRAPPPSQRSRIGVAAFRHDHRCGRRRRSLVDHPAAGLALQVSWPGEQAEIGGLETAAAEGPANPQAVHHLTVATSASRNNRMSMTVVSTSTRPPWVHRHCHARPRAAATALMQLLGADTEHGAAPSAPVRPPGVRREHANGSHGLAHDVDAARDVDTHRTRHAAASAPVQVS